MYRKQLNERSPLRVFERSTHGGLGAGNLGVVMSRAGVGKSAFLVGVALDDLMRNRRVLHINIDDPVEKVREFYDEVFHDLAASTRLENRDAVHLAVERNRMIHTYTHQSFEMGKVRHAIDLMKEHMHFSPDAVMIDGYPDFETTTEDEVRELKNLARELRAEMWLTALKRREDADLDDRGIPRRVARFEEYVSVVVELESAHDHVRLQLLKDHANPDVAHLHIELDPRTLLLKWR